MAFRSDLHYNGVFRYRRDDVQVWISFRVLLVHGYISTWILVLVSTSLRFVKNKFKTPNHTPCRSSSSSLSFLSFSSSYPTWPSSYQTLIDDSPAVVPYSVLSPFSFIASLPAIPSIGARRAPLKVLFQQKVQLSPSSSPSAVEDTNAKVVTTLLGPASFLERVIFPYLPSSLHSVADRREVRCSERDIDERKNVNGPTMIPVPGNRRKVLDSKLVNNPSYSTISTNTSSSPFGARFFVAGNSSRAFRVYFDRPVHKSRVQTIDLTKVIIDEDAGWEVQRGGPPSSSRSTASSNVHSRRPQQVLSNPNTMEETHSGRVACEWAEYESGMIGMGFSVSSSSLPFPGEDSINRVVSGSHMFPSEEVLAFLPK
ncbi:hypothetical protein GYMLUDRAFT_243928 [Collybiopsis luxurians FD-317 M1]|uniref:Uncharacterized protein n=1 Tax=Collybiopsis luxurians FD-317 M1 TaxID=944289 RepID=A0A0D0CE24_9AGAR|nr:hypothetical protein GYMLUDRAFT_243928 [Collybiopsis luxurians FD-317 M1]